MTSGEWFPVPRRGPRLRLGCCDCGLVHDIDGRVRRGRIELRAWRNNRATAAHRRGKQGRAFVARVRQDGR